MTSKPTAFERAVKMVEAAVQRKYSEDFIRMLHNDLRREGDATILEAADRLRDTAFENNLPTLARWRIAIIESRPNPNPVDTLSVKIGQEKTSELQELAEEANFTMEKALELADGDPMLAGLLQAKAIAQNRGETTGILEQLIKKRRWQMAHPDLIKEEIAGYRARQRAHNVKYGELSDKRNFPDETKELPF